MRMQAARVGADRRRCRRLGAYAGAKGMRVTSGIARETYSLVDWLNATGGKKKKWARKREIGETRDSSSSNLGDDLKSSSF